MVDAHSRRAVGVERHHHADLLPDDNPYRIAGGFAAGRLYGFPVPVAHRAAAFGSHSVRHRFILCRRPLEPIFQRHDLFKSADLYPLQLVLRDILVQNEVNIEMLGDAKTAAARQGCGSC